MYKRFLFILTVCVFLFGMATKAETEVAESESNPVKETYGPLIKPEEEPALYKTEINPVTPETGITTGHVIAYGHYIKPPYKVEIVSDTMLFINGVQIFPVLPSKFEIEKKRREEIRSEKNYSKADSISETYFKRLHILFNEMRNVYESLEPQVGRVKALDSVYKLAEAETLIVKIDTTFVGEDDCSLLIDYFLPGRNDSQKDLIGFGMGLKGGNPSSGYTFRPVSLERDLNARRKATINFKNGIEKSLRNELLLYYTHKNRGFRSEYYLWLILEVLKTNTLDVRGKIEKLSKITNNEAAKEFVYNFDPDEWPVEKEDKKK